MATDPNPPASPPDTTGVRGATGPLPVGTQFVALDAETTVFGGGADGDQVNAKVNGGLTDTSATGGANDPSLFVPVVTGLLATPDTVQGGGGMRLDKDQAYRAPAGPVAASGYDTTRTDSPTSGTVLVTNKTHVKLTGVTTIVTDSAVTYSQGQIAVLVSVDADLDGSQVVATSPTPGTFTFVTHKPGADIASVAVVGGMVSFTTMGYLTDTQDSTTIGAVPAVGTAQLVAPTGVTATANNHGGIDLAWTPAAQSGGAVVKRWMVESDRGYSQSVPANVTTFDTYSAWMLEAGVAITFTVRAVNDFGSSPKSTASAPVTPKNVNFTGYTPGAFFPDATQNPIQTPSGGVNFMLAGAQARDTIVYTWVLPPTDHAYSAGVLKVFDATGAQVGSDHVLAGTDTTVTVTGLTYGTTYHATMSMTNSVGTITEDPVYTTLALLVPAAAAAPTAVDAGAGSHNATVTYANPADTGGSAITSHVIQWSADSFATVAGSTTDAASPVTAVTGAGTWKFRVAAVSAVGHGAFSVASADVTVA